MAAESHLVVEEIPVEECLELLRTQQVGRLAVVTPNGPAIFPVNYALGGDRVVFRTDAGTKLDHATLQRVAFEIDAIDAAHGTGWSVVVEGVGTEITAAIDTRSVELQGLEVHPFAPGTKAHLVEIQPRSISGRRIVLR
jgi:nitroimidazol reductase NimA-like FMN-containing flavoprotein (pyridoxamine 5'-phosphate oxidase superfamily)